MPIKNKRYELNDTALSVANVAATPAIRKLQVGDKVTLNNGEKHTILAITYGGSEAVGHTAFYRWDVEWPYDIVHAAMSPAEHEIVLENSQAHSIRK